MTKENKRLLAYFIMLSVAITWSFVFLRDSTRVVQWSNFIGITLPLMILIRAVS